MINDNATLIPGAAHYYTAPVGTAFPVDPLAPGATWQEVGHTPVSDLLGISSDGGEATVISTAQNKSLRTTYSTRTDTMSFQLAQFDKSSLKLYYGSNAVEVDGMVGPNVNPIPTTTAFLVVFVDGENHFEFYVPKCEIYRGDDFEIADMESLAALPLAVKPMQLGSNQYTFLVSPLGEV